MRNIILLFIILLIPIVVLGKSFYYPQIKTEIHFTPNGDAHVLQERTYYFKGYFSWAYLELKKKSADNIIFNQLLEEIDGTWHKIEPEIVDNPQSLYIRWTYTAQNEIKTFLVDYTIIGAVKRYEDAAEFYWKFIEDEHEKIENIILELYLPEKSPDLFKVYIHSQARPGTIKFNETFDKAVVEQKKIPKNAFVEVRMFTSPSIFPEVPILTQTRYQDFLKQEKHNFLVSSLKKFILFPIGLLLMIVLPLILLIIFYNKYGREPKLPYLGMYEHEPPRKAPPVVVPAILSQKPDKNTIYQSMFRGMFASMLDITTKGLVSIQEIENKKHYQFTLEKPENIDKLDPFNKKVANFFFESKNQITDKELQIYAQKHPTQFRAYLSNLYEQAIKWWESTLGNKLLDPISSKFYNSYLLIILPSIIVGTIFAGIGLSALIGGPNPPFFIFSGILAIILFIIFISTSRVIVRWSPEAHLEQKRWHNFKKFLSEGSAIEQAPITLLPIWEYYFVYAVALGVAQKFLKNITKLAEKQGIQLSVPIWYISATAHAPSSVSSLAESISSFQTFANNFTNMINSFSTSAASGGGFSGGGGAGGGGGSSGAG
ncbi:MAG: DUF2207 domain-containing protein [candidate division WOR-3 bacterium]|nr:DUF2207 domain-containing protein [candidate division WOR-3 bacterium]